MALLCRPYPDVVRARRGVAGARSCCMAIGSMLGCCKGRLGGQEDQLMLGHDGVLQDVMPWAMHVDLLPTILGRCSMLSPAPDPIKA